MAEPDYFDLPDASALIPQWDIQPYQQVADRGVQGALHILRENAMDVLTLANPESLREGQLLQLIMAATDVMELAYEADTGDKRIAVASIVLWMESMAALHDRDVDREDAFQVFMADKNVARFLELSSN